MQVINLPRAGYYSNDMDEKVYAFYRTAEHVVLEPGIRIQLRKWAGRLSQIFASGNDVWQLHLDNPEDFNDIRRSFFDASHWDGRTWQDEYNEKQ